MRGVWNALTNFTHNANEAIYAVQKRVGDIYSDRFTLKVSLALALILGGGFAFIGGDCWGRVRWMSPITVILLIVTLFFFFQTFVLVPLTLWRIFRLLLVGFCGHYLAYQIYAFWSLENLGDTIEIYMDSNVCQPYVYANIPYGYGWAFAPAILLVLAAFLADGKEEFEDE